MGETGLPDRRARGGLRTSRRLLSRRLTKDEIIDIVIKLRGSGVLPNETGRIGAAIMGTTNEVPSIEEIERVRHHLAEVTGTDFNHD